MGKKEGAEDASLTSWRYVVPIYDDDCDDQKNDDLYIIGAVCLFVTKVIISVFKGFGRFTRFSYIPYSKELVVSMFLTLSVFKGFGRFHFS